MHTPKNTGLTERCLIGDDRRARPCDANHMIASIDSDRYGLGAHWRGFTTPSGTWLEVRWLTDFEGHVTYVYEDTRGLNRP